MMVLLPTHVIDCINAKINSFLEGIGKRDDGELAKNLYNQMVDVFCEYGHVPDIKPTDDGFAQE